MEADLRGATALDIACIHYRCACELVYLHTKCGRRQHCHSKPYTELCAGEISIILGGTHKPREAVPVPKLAADVLFTIV